MTRANEFAGGRFTKYRPCAPPTWDGIARSHLRLGGGSGRFSADRTPRTAAEV